MPVIGHLHLLRGPQLPHITLSNLSEKHGPIFTIRLGMKQGLIVNNWELAKECLTTNDIVLSTRPQTTALKRLCYDAAMFGFHTHDAYWRDMRKIMVTNLLANIRDVRETELKPCIKSLYEACVKSETQSATVDMKRWLWDVTFKLVFRIVAGSTREMDLSEREKWRSVA
ncbi:cytochrome P450, partial [Acinetobacter baumannii]